MMQLHKTFQITKSVKGKAIRTRAGQVEG